MSAQTQLPMNMEAEKAVLGAMLMDTDAIADAHELVRPEHFYSERHQILYSAILRLFERNIAIDPVSLSNDLRSAGKLETIGGANFIFEVAGSVATSANVRHHAELVLERYQQRRLLALAQNIQAKLSAPVADNEELFTSTEAEILAIREQETGKGAHRIGESLVWFMDKLEEQRQAKRKIAGISTGFDNLDELTGGIMPGETCILAARPGVGKSAFALNMAYAAASFDPHLYEQIPTLFFSLEMTEQQILKRLYSMATRINGSDIRHARLDDSQMKTLHDESNRLYDLPLYIDDRVGLNALEMMMVARRMKRRHGIKLIVVDYLQIMGTHSRGRNREQEVAENMRLLSGMGKKFDCAMLVLSQLSRASVQNGEDKAPHLHHLRESGAIEQDANMVMFLHPEECGGVETGGTRVLVEKNRDDNCGERVLQFYGEFTLFEQRAVASF